MISTREFNKQDSNHSTLVKKHHVESTPNHNSCGGCNSCHQMTGIHSMTGSQVFGGGGDGEHGSNIQKTCATNFLQRNLGNSYMQTVAGDRQTSGSSSSGSGAPMIQKKCSCGGSCSGGTGEEELQGIQTKLTVGSPNDVYEQEADYVAEAVMNIPDPGMPAPTSASHNLIQRKCGACKEEDLMQRQPSAGQIMPMVQCQLEEIVPKSVPPTGEEREEDILQTKAIGGGISEVSAIVQSQIGQLRGGGQPLSASVRSFLEQRIGYDFNHVRIHTDRQAAEAAQSVSARAFTVGREVVFGSGEYAPGTVEGKRLLAHELTHVIQQNQAHALPGSSRLGSLSAQVQAKMKGDEILQRWSVNGPAAPALNTIVCDGSGGIAVQLGSTGNANQTKCLSYCIRRHELSHRSDALAANADLCKDKAANSQILFGPGEQDPSECRAYNSEITCLNRSLQIADATCKPIMQARITQITPIRDSHCP